MREPVEHTFPNKGYSRHRGHSYTRTEHPDDTDLDNISCECGEVWHVRHDPHDDDERDDPEC